MFRAIHFPLCMTCTDLNRAQISLSLCVKQPSRLASSDPLKLKIVREDKSVCALEER